MAKVNRQNEKLIPELLNFLEYREGKLPGCSFNRIRKKWQASITINGIGKSLGYYDTEYAASEAYKLFKRDLKC